MTQTKYFVFLVLCCAFWLTHAQFLQNDKNELIVGHADSLYSEVLKEKRDLWIHLPQNFDDTKKFPVIYLLDASNHFYAFAGMQKQLTPFTIPEAIIVGIKNTDRTRDFTPTNVKFNRGQNSETSGGALPFIQFIEQELKPYINTKYPTEDNTTIIGHSTAGLLVLYAYLNHEHTFDNYLAIDPSLWWDKDQLVNSAEDKLKKGDRKEKSLYIAVANSIGKAMDTVKVRQDKSEPTEQIRANLKFHDILVDHKASLNFSWEYFHNEDHGSIVIPALYNGIRDIYSWFPFPELWRLNTPKSYTAQELTGPFYSHYETLSKKMKREAKPDWQMVNNIADYMLNGHKLPEKALAYLKMNADFYPDASKSYVALGNYYVTQKNEAEAIKNYRKALAIDGNEQAKEKLKALGED